MVTDGREGMSGNWKITIVGGSLNGMDFSFPPDREVLIGRSSKADVRLSSSESDVSGKHLKLVLVDGIPTAVNVTSRRHASSLRTMRSNLARAEESASGLTPSRLTSLLS